MKKNLLERRILFLFLINLLPSLAKAQHQALDEKPAIWKSDTAKAPDDGIQALFKKANFSGHFRYMFMATDNAKGLSDYYANALGGGLRMETQAWHGFRLAVSGFYSFNIGSSNLVKADSLSGQKNRYEVGLFDITDPSNKKNIDRLEELYLRYDRKTWKLVLGKQLINTPFINLQDGRMRPTGVNGLYAEKQITSKSRLEGFLLYGISPRSTTKWYSIGESVGLYAQGVNLNGSKSNYAQHISAKYIGMLAWHQSFKHRWQTQWWHLYADRLMYTSLFQVDKKWEWLNGQWQGSAQVIHQQSLSQFDPLPQAGQYYMEPHAKATSFGFQAIYKKKQHQFYLQYNRITAQGRYLMPREWGRDPFFTFMPRERNEGLGNMQAWVIRYHWLKPSKAWQWQLAGGIYQLPSPDNYRLNKYGMPSYAQAMLDWRYRFSGRLNGLECQALFTAKWALKTPEKSSNIINKVNMLHTTISANYRF
ncbi:MAG: hypothetical protein ACR2IL_02925 [Chitinophagaceae bacterium]